MLTSSGYLRPESLCVKPGLLVWCLYIDLVCLDQAGNVLDAAVSALTAALASTSLPSVSVDPESGEVAVSATERSPLPLATSPVSSTFAVFPDPASATPHILSDPSREEEQLADCTLTVVTVGDDVCHVQQSGGAQVEPGLLQQAVHLSLARAKLVETTIPS